MSNELVSVSFSSAPAIIAHAAKVAVSAAPAPPLQFTIGNRALAAGQDHLQLRLSGAAGTTVVVESSSDLLHWTAVSTNTVPAEGLSLSLPTTPQPAQFFRAKVRQP